MHTCRYKAAIQEAQIKSRSVAVAMQSLQQKQAQGQHAGREDCQPQRMQPGDTLLRSALKQSSCSPSREAVDRLRPMTASSILQAKLGVPVSILARPGSALSR